MSKREDIRERRSRLSPAKLLLLEKHLRGDLPDENEQDAIPRREGQEFVALSFGQERLYFLSQFVPDSPFYNVPLGVRLKGSLNIDALERSLSEIVRRHEALRTNFNMIDGQLAQVINPALAVRLPLHSLESVPAATREEEARRVAIEEVKRPFDLAQEVLLRCMLFRLQEQDHVLLLVLHHIIFDDWSKMVFTKEMATLYEAFSEGKPSPLSELPIQYADYAMWQRSEKHASVLKEKLSYWKRHLDGSIAALELPTDRPRPAIQTFRGAVERFDL
ncbi:MAG TPA: condensation domain-containing protein, partial [Blastocatellia bacterium]